MKHCLKYLIYLLNGNKNLVRSKWRNKTSKSILIKLRPGIQTSFLVVIFFVLTCKIFAEISLRLQRFWQDCGKISYFLPRVASPAEIVAISLWCLCLSFYISVRSHQDSERHKREWQDKYLMIFISDFREISKISVKILHS